MCRGNILPPQWQPYMPEGGPVAFDQLKVAQGTRDVVYILLCRLMVSLLVCVRDEWKGPFMSRCAIRVCCVQ